MVCAAFHSCAAPLLSCAPCSTCMQHPLPGLHLALLACPSHLHHSLPGLHCPSFCAPVPHVQSPSVWSSPDVWASLHVTPPAWPSPCAHPHPSCASGMRANGCVGVVGHPNGGGRRAAWVEGPAHKWEGGGTIPCASLACMQSGRACAWQVAHKLGGMGSSQGGGACLQTEREGGELCLPCPQCACKGCGVRAGGVGCSLGGEANGRGGVGTVPPAFTQRVGEGARAAGGA